MTTDPARRTRAFVLPDPSGVLRARFQPGPAVGGPAPRFSEYVFAVDERDRLVDRPRDDSTGWPTWAGGFRDLSTTTSGETPRPLGWRAGQEAVFVTIDAATSPLAAAAPRQTLVLSVDRLRAAGLTARIGFELEFRLIDAAAPGRSSRAYGMEVSTAELGFFARLVPALAASGIGVDSWSREGGPAQWELALDHAAPRDAADAAALTRLAVLEVAPEFGLVADFAPSHAGGFGSGLHAHVSLADDAGAAVLHLDAAGTPSGPGAWALEGVLAILADATALLTPSAPGFARFTAHSAAGTAATWAPENRSTGIRHLERGAATRFEVRVPASDADPYAVVAALLAGAADGVDRRSALRPATVGDGYAGIPASAALPATLAEAADRLTSSAVLRAVLGHGFVDHQVTLARWRAAHP